MPNDRLKSAVDRPLDLGWPIPPFFRAAGEPVSGVSRTCVVELTAGGSIQGVLVSFEPERGHIDLQSPDGHINRPDQKIWTAEDPVEITQAGLRQVQINARIGWTFANAMRAFLRADPHVIMVGEMRDAETTKIGIEASLTGHLELSTLHTNSAAESVVRLLDLGMDTFNFADALIGILSQRLARKLCEKCKKEREASNAELSDLVNEFCAGSSLDPVAVLEGWRKSYGRNGRLFLYEPVGCKECSNGWRGPMGVHELLIASSEVKHLIRSRGSVPQHVEAERAGGMQLLRQDALLKVLSGSLDLVAARATGS